MQMQVGLTNSSHNCNAPFLVGQFTGKKTDDISRCFCMQSLNVFVFNVYSKVDSFKFQLLPLGFHVKQSQIVI